MDNKSSLEQAVLKYVQRPEYQPVKPAVIAKKLGFETDRFSDVKLAVKRLVRRGKLAYGSMHRVRLPQPESAGQQPAGRHAAGRHGSAATGVFRRASGGFGFVKPENSPPGDRSQDIFIPARKTADAADGDLVAVRLRGQRRRGNELRWAGEIVEVLRRETHRFVGLYNQRDGIGVVRVDGAVFAQPILVGDPGAKSAHAEDKVVIEMVRFPTQTDDGEAVIVEVLGKRGAPGVDTLSIIREFDLPEEFPEDVLEDARRSADRFDETIADGRQDYRQNTVITIDPFDARDFDDAISLDRLENGHWRLGVHIADVSHFVQPKTRLDQEARERATSVYLPGRVVPMLPETISNHLASLQPGRVRFTKSVFLEFTADGARVSAEIYNGAILSDRRFTYAEVDDFLARRQRWKEKLSPTVFELLGGMHELAMILRRRRLDRGAIELTLPDIKVDLDKNGQVAGAHLEEQTESHQIIEEFMLAANEAVAEWLYEKELFFLRRIHEQPDPRKLRALAQFVRELGFSCEGLQNRFEIKRVVEEVAGQPQEYAVHFAVLRSMRKARYSPEEEGHYALHSEHYGHFTSPIRRYPDLTIHRMLTQLIAGKKPSNDFDRMMLLGEHCSQREQRAESAERELTKVKLLNFLRTRIGQTMKAVITGVERFGLFAQGTELPAEGFIHISSLDDDFYEYEAASHTLTGHRLGNAFRLGDLVQVEIAHVDVDRRQLDFRLPPPDKRRKRGKTAKQGQKLKSARPQKKRGKK